MTAAPAMHRKAVALAALVVVAVRAELRRLLWRLLRLAAGDERRQAADIVAEIRLLLRLLGRLRLLLILLRLLLRPRILRLLLRLRCAVGLRAAVGLLLRLLLRLLEILLVRHPLRGLAGLLVAFVLPSAVVVAGTLRSRLRLVVRVLLPELLLRRSDQTQVMLGVLMVRLGGDVIANRRRIARELQIFLGDVMGGAADFHLRPVRLIHSRQRIVVVVTAVLIVLIIIIIIIVIAIASAHALILSVSHHGLLSPTP